jgi:hypothetical protein
MLVGSAVGVVLAIITTLLVTTSIRPDAAIALVLAVPTVLGMSLIVSSSRRWVTALGAFVVALAPGWFSVLVMIQVVHGG